MSLDEIQQKDIEYLTRDLANLDKKVDAGFRDLKHQILLIGDTFVRKDVHEKTDKEFMQNLQATNERIDSIVDSNKWLFRTVVTTVIGLLGTVILTFLK